MKQARRTTVAVIFGGRSVEHDVSIVTGNQVMRAFPDDKYDIAPVYITRDGKWLTGASLLDLETFSDGAPNEGGDLIPCLLSPDTRHHGLILNPLAGRFSRSEVKRVDVVFPALHGSHGEDGSLQGLLELADIPYVGLRYAGLGADERQGDDQDCPASGGTAGAGRYCFFRAIAGWMTPTGSWRGSSNAFDYPLFIKPATLGSSIGIGRADSEALLRASIDIAANFDRRILVEPALADCVEINCAVMGYGGDYQASPLEQPLSWDDFLSFEDKYLRGGEGMKSAERIIPAPISDAMTERIKQLSINAFKAVDGRGNRPFGLSHASGKR